MSDKVSPAMQKTDYVSPDDSQVLGFLKDLLMGFVPVSKWAMVAAGTAFGGPLGFAVGIGLSIALDAAFNAAADFAVEGLADLTAKPGEPLIEEGSPNVFFNSLEAARGGEQGDPTTRQRIAQGSMWVDINTRPAARQGDRVKGSGKVVLLKGRVPNIFIGGDPTEYDNKLELNPDLQKLIDVAELANALKGLPKGGKELLENAKKAIRSYQNGYKGVAAIRATAMGKEAFEKASSIWEKASKVVQ